MATGDDDQPDTAPGSARTPHFHGHRQRLKDRFLETGGDQLADYELMELVLFQALPRRDVKPLAKDLLDRFGSFAGVATAEASLIRQVPGAGDAVVVALKTVAAAAERLARDELAAAPVLANWDKLLKYCRTAMSREGREQFRVLYLNRKNVLIKDEVQWRGTIDHTPLYPREVVKRALELQAAALIMVHNHPSGDPTPSQADIEMTRQVAEAANSMGIVLHDHLIVAKSGHTSFRDMGYL
ncbi:DNA repair protein RadC [Thalassospiraceae bacterium LMO-SO8]|nr:DNA repair protein RadC [Alphaproteobacteria bacterium LMO-S08]WND74512.1 DNA repair protein RadC [Thalassospiraceae bacterium LMO-SO8]